MARVHVLSVVIVVDGVDAAAQAAIRSVHATLVGLEAICELVVVVRGATPSDRAALVQLTAELPDVQVYLLQGWVDHLTALLAGIENAVGDWVATLDPYADAPGEVVSLFRRVLADGTEIGLAVDSRRNAQGGVADRLASRAFHRLFRLLHGYDLHAEAPSVRVMSRAAINSVLSHESPLVAFETVAALGGYSKTVVETASIAPQHLATKERIMNRWRTLIGINAMPLRLANAVCAIGAALAVLYSLYVVVVYLIKEDVAPGWTTMSLVLSAMFFMMSLVLWLLSEYMVLLTDAGGRRPRYHIAEELSSTVQTRRAQLNVESEL